MTSDDASADAPEILRPNRRVFLWRPLIRTAILGTVFALAAHLFLPLFATVDPGLGVLLGIAAAFVVYTAISRIVAFRRTFYEFYDDRLVVKSGTIATRSTVDLPYRNVTQVVLRLPFVERRLFKTGHLSIHAAGSARGIARLQSIDAPREVYDEMADRLRDNGFSLERDRVLQREKPHIIGTALDTSGLAIGGLIALITIGFTVAGTVVDLLDLDSYYELFDVLTGAVEPDDAEEATAAQRATLGVALLAILGGSYGLGRLALHFVDLNRRIYTLWNDVVDYEDGFLTETYKFVPIENLADTATEEPFLKRLFGMADVHLSPHGSASGIRFPSMPRAEKFRRNLDQLIESTDAPVPVELDDEEGEVSEEEVQGARATGVKDRLPDVKGPALEFGPSFLRRAATGVIQAFKLPFFLVAIAFTVWGTAIWTAFDPAEFGVFVDIEELEARWIIYGGLAIFAGLSLYQLFMAAFFCWTTSYRVGRRKLSWERDFISRDEIEFTTDKITTLETQRDLLDRLMGTATLVFRSIGNPAPIVFNDIARADERTDELRRRLGLLDNADEALATHRPTANPLDLFLGRLYTTTFIWIIAIAGAVAANIYWPPGVYLAGAFATIPILRILHNAVYYPRCFAQIFDDHLLIKRGIIFQERHYVAYDQLRSVISTRYPLRSTGILELVPGSTTRISLPYLRDIRELHELLDDKLYRMPMRPTRQADDFDRSELSRRTPQARNGILKASVFTLLVALVTLIPVILLYVHTRRTDIIVEKGRVRRLQGILYRTTQTVLINRIDQLLIDRGPVNTLFRNGQVSVLTVGSTIPDLVLGPIPDDQALYDELEELLPRRSG